MLTLDEVGAVLREWSVDTNLSRRRASIISQVGRRERTGPSLLTAVIETILADTSMWTCIAIGGSVRGYAYTSNWDRAHVALWGDQLSSLSRASPQKASLDRSLHEQLLEPAAHSH